MYTLLALLLLAQSHSPLSGIGLEWMPIASFIVPAVVLVAIIWYGSKHTA